MTGEFTPATKRLIMTRDHGICQWCGDEVSVGGFNFQHRRARGAGGVGKKNTVTRSPANGVLVHPIGSCHGLIEANPVQALDRGFRVYQGTDPRRVPLVDWRGNAWLLTDTGQRLLADRTDF
jgi:hypothetical protein